MLESKPTWPVGNFRERAGPGTTPLERQVFPMNLDFEALIRANFRFGRM